MARTAKAIHGELTPPRHDIMLTRKCRRWVLAARKQSELTDEFVSADENCDKTVAKAVKLGAAPKGEVMDMFGRPL